MATFTAKETRSAQIDVTAGTTSIRPPYTDDKGVKHKARLLTGISGVAPIEMTDKEWTDYENIVLVVAARAPNLIDVAKTVTAVIP